MARPPEIALGDRFFSPFIAPGWSEKEELNLRPSQDLAILKSLMAAGAEYIHVGFFNSAARPANWIWQAVMPVYSQGVATAVADLWRHSSLLRGDMPLPTWRCYTNGTPLKGNKTLQELCAKFPLSAAECGFTNVVAQGQRCAAPSTGGWHAPVSYRFWAGSQSIPVYVRKHDSKDQYLVVASVQPQSNMIGNAPDTANITIYLTHDLPVAFEARRQGSVYVLDMTKADDGDLSGRGGATLPPFFPQNYM